MIKKIDKKAFTLIEVIVVVAIIGILALLAVPRFIGQTQKAELVGIQHDVKAMEKEIGAKLINGDDSFNEWGSNSKDLNKLAENKELFENKGVAEKVDSTDGTYKVIPKEYKAKINTKLKGTFYANSGGKVYYEHGEMPGYSDEDKGEVPYDEWLKDLENKGYVVAQDSDFTWVAVSWAPNLYDHDDNDTTPNAKGYFQYTGTDKYVIVPERIKGNVLKDAYGMFRDSPVEGVAMNNESVTDMSYMFANNPSTSLDVSNLVTENAWNMGGMFYCSQTTSLDLSNFDTSNVTNMAYMFNQTEATSLDLSNFDTSKVTDMEGMFWLNKATNIDLSNFDTSNVTNMKEMFRWGKATSLDVSSFDTSKVTNMSQMFNYIPATILDVSGFDTSKVTDMAYMFNQTKATILDVSNFDTSNVTDMEGMFSYSQATTLDVSNFDTSNVENMRGMFKNSKATSLDLSSFNTSNVREMFEMFKNSHATSLDLSSFTSNSNWVFASNMFEGSLATTIDLSSFDTSNASIDRMFKDSKATTGYAKTIEDANNFNTSYEKPSTLTFVVK